MSVCQSSCLSVCLSVCSTCHALSLFGPFQLVQTDVQYCSYWEGTFLIREIWGGNNTFALFLSLFFFLIERLSDVCVCVCKEMFQLYVKRIKFCKCLHCLLCAVMLFSNPFFVIKSTAYKEQCSKVWNIFILSSTHPKKQFFFFFEWMNQWFHLSTGPNKRAMIVYPPKLLFLFFCFLDSLFNDIHGHTQLWCDPPPWEGKHGGTRHGMDGITREIFFAKYSSTQVPRRGVFGSSLKKERPLWHVCGFVLWNRTIHQ